MARRIISFGVVIAWISLLQAMESSVSLLPMAVVLGLGIPILSSSVARKREASSFLLNARLGMLSVYWSLGLLFLSYISWFANVPSLQPWKIGVWVVATCLLGFIQSYLEITHALSQKNVVA
jgi:hypothetical protein